MSHLNGGEWRLEGPRNDTGWRRWFEGPRQWWSRVLDTVLGMPRHRVEGLSPRQRSETPSTTRTEPVNGRPVVRPSSRPATPQPRNSPLPVSPAIAFEPPGDAGVYATFFGFSRSPFNIPPDPYFYYQSAQHQEALANLVYGVRDRKGFAVLTGEVGTGKTMLLECLRDYLAYHDIEFASISNSRLNGPELLEMMAFELALDCDKSSRVAISQALSSLLLARAGEGSTTVLIVDEAQNLGWDALEEIRLLSNLESRGTGLMQIVLAGQPEFEEKLEDDRLRQLNDRITLHSTLQPFEVDDTVSYVASRLSRAGMAEPTVFPPDVLGEIHARSQGIPRIINAICDNLLLTAFSASRAVTTLAMLEEVARDLRLDRRHRKPAAAVSAPPGPGSAAERQRGLSE